MKIAHCFLSVSQSQLYDSNTLSLVGNTLSLVGWLVGWLSVCLSVLFVWIVDSYVSRCSKMCMMILQTNTNKSNGERCHVGLYVVTFHYLVTQQATKQSVFFHFSQFTISPTFLLKNYHTTWRNSPFHWKETLTMRHAPKSYRWSGDLYDDLCLGYRWKIDRFRLRFMRGD